VVTEVQDRRFLVIGEERHAVFPLAVFDYCDCKKSLTMPSAFWRAYFPFSYTPRACQTPDGSFKSSLSERPPAKFCHASYER